MPEAHRKYFFPLESNPDVFNELIHFSWRVERTPFRRCLGPRRARPASATHPRLDPHLPRHARAPGSAGRLGVHPRRIHRQRRRRARGLVQTDHWQCLWPLRHLACTEQRFPSPLHWWKQTLDGRPFGRLLTDRCPEPESILSRLLDKCIPQDPANRARVLEGSAELEQAHAAVAKKGDSAVPERAENEVDYHYICFARSEVNGCLYQLDGNRKGSVVVGEISIGDDGDILNEAVISHVKAYIGQGGGNIGFGCMALVHRAT
ncbi:hypothetical protein VTK26DRAFT_7461 [Humicola hyalothermophila]